MVFFLQGKHVQLSLSLAAENIKNLPLALVKKFEFDL